MKLSLFVAQRLSLVSRGMSSQTRAKGRSLLTLSVVGVSLSLVVMLLSLSILLGFREQIHRYAYSQTGHLSLYAQGSTWLETQSPVKLSSKALDFIASRPYVSAVYPIVQQTALLKTEDTFAGVMLYGLSEGMEMSYYKESMREGVYPRFSPSDSLQHPIVLPSEVARTMGYKVGDKVRVYSMDESIRLRAYTVVGIYESAGMSTMPALCTIADLRRSAHLGEDEYSRVQIYLHNPGDADALAQTLSEELTTYLGLDSREVVGWTIVSGRSLLVDLFDWLELIDSNVYILFVLMLLVGGFTMITGLIILVLDKRRHIGVLKALGATDGQLRRIFLLLGQRIILRSMLVANILTLVLCYVQWRYRILKLDSSNYFMDAVPISFDWRLWLGLNTLTFVLILSLLLLPARIISRIDPSEVMRME